MQSALKKVKGVRSATASMPGHAEVTYSGDVKLADLQKALKKAGYAGTKAKK